MSRRNTLIGAVIVALAVAAIPATSLTIFPPPADAQRLLTTAAEQTVVKTYTYVISSGQTPQTDD